MQIRLILLVFGLSLLPLKHTEAITVIWGNDVFETMQDSTGTDMTSSFKFELGSFASGFAAGSSPGTAQNPSSLTVTQRISFWKPLDIATFGNLSWNPVTGQFTRSSDLPETGLNTNIGQSGATGHQFATGEQLYIWAHNGTDFSPGSATEYALFTTSTGTIPNFESHTAPGNMDMNPADVTTIIYGNSVTDSGIQTELNPSPIPEPGTGALLALSGLAMALGRRR